MLRCDDVIGMTPTEEAVTFGDLTRLLVFGVTLVVTGAAAETLDSSTC